MRERDPSTIGNALASQGTERMVCGVPTTRMIQWLCLELGEFWTLELAFIVKGF